MLFSSLGTCSEYAYTALAHGLIALCHAPNYNFKGAAYYESTLHLPDAQLPDHMCTFPSQIVADRHSQIALLIVEEIKRQHQQRVKQKKNQQESTTAKMAIEKRKQPTIQLRHSNKINSFNLI
jgi:hypothetical protein